jgi:hypothetical protein
MNQGRETPMDNELGSRAAHVAELAAKAASIARAASVSGLYGAAAEATRQYLPKLLKIIAVLLVLVLLLPVIIFASIPHYLFGWLGSGDKNVIRMTELAADITAVYERFDDILKKAADSLVQTLSAPFEDILPIEVSMDDGNTSLTWFIAIVAVHYEQDLNIISESAIAQMASNKLLHSVAAGKSLVRIKIWDMLPDALMRFLGFSEEQRNWAELLVSSMTDWTVTPAEDADALRTESWSGHFTSQGHFIVLRGVTEDGKILVAGPAGVSLSNQLWDSSLILEEANRVADAKGPFWVIG